MNTWTAGVGTLLLATLATAQAMAQSAPAIPTGHPRLWLSSPDQRQRAEEWLAAQGQMPAADDHAGNAFVALLSDDPARCTAAVDWLVGFTLPDVGNVSSDNARWYGETAALVFDWCHASMSASQRATVITRWNGYLDVLNAKDWGGQGYEANNYFWGYLRNDLNWAIATWHENPRAPDFLAHGLDTRYRDWFIDGFVPAFGVGGVAGEGTQYGRYMLSYPVVPFLSLRDYGIDPYPETGFHAEALYQLAYSLTGATPGPPSEPGCPGDYRYFMPFNDDEAFFLCFPEVARSTDYGMFLLAMAEAGSARQSAHARRLFSELQPRLPYWARYRAPTGAGEGFGALPADYHAAGAGYVWARAGWAADDAVVMLQLASPGAVGHRHLDTGSFQFWRAGAWVSRETTAYTDLIAGPGGEGLVDGGTAVGHNTFLFEGRAERGWESGGPRTIPEGQRRRSNPDGLAQVTRLHRESRFLYAATDLSLPYRAQRSEDPCRYDWPFAERIEREFLFLRELDALVVFDRARSGDDSLAYVPSHCRQIGYSDYAGPRLAADEVRKTFLMHFLTAPTLAGNVSTAMVDGQAVRLHNLLPLGATRRVVDEQAGDDGSVGQYRLEIESSGQAQSYFLNVLEAGGAGVPALSASVDTSAVPWRLSLSRPGSTPVVMEIEPGERSTGGAVNFGGERVVLLDRVQHNWVDADGPHWEEVSATPVDPLDPPADAIRTVSRERDHFDLALEGLPALSAARFAATPLVAPQRTVQDIPADPTPADPYDAPAANLVRWLSVPAAQAGGLPRTFRLRAVVRSTGGMALMLGRDLNGNGRPDAGEERCRSDAGPALVACEIAVLEEATVGSYWLMAQAVAGPGVAVQVDAYAIALAASETPDALVATGPGQVEAGEGFRLRVGYDDASLLEGEDRVGYVLVHADAGAPVGVVPVRLSRTGSSVEPFVLANGAVRAVMLRPGQSHDRLFFDVPPHATAVQFALRDSTGNLDLHVSREASPVAPAIAAAPPWNSQPAFRAATAGGDETLVLSGANLQPGRHYVVPSNPTSGTVSGTVVATVMTQGTRPAFRAGHYANPARSGQGLFVDFAGPQGAPDQWVAVWYAYLEDGTPTWYYAQGGTPGADGTWRADLLRVTWNGALTHAVDVGELVLTPAAAEAMTLSYNLDGRSGSEPMQRIGGGTCPMPGGQPLDLTGHWYSPTLPGFGYSYQATGGADPQEVFIPYLYDGQGYPRWLYGQKGFAPGSETFALQWFSGFSPLAAAVPLTGTPAGTGRRTIAGSGIARMTVDATLTGALSGRWVQDRPVALLSQPKLCQ
ncbi:hypothetical protein [Arenimonas terrae]|uniref:Alginate lyase domain-containing protein n=1 Tax=Arenimonas terrae TaxID=2546226 RepID=A0A5C4RWQ0_9GAMM|nr:hypothetical protein [Arenimonas terrae]TNJ35319.1 hypothetical protein E1B00_06075 [Arenimonas terrae]